ncbi:MAG: replication factor C large subunit [Candidatus Micrarchaeota archaeon]|nr:replication factor C large subunit [Candidatus Micrarchaeota archaeon]
MLLSDKYHPKNLEEFAGNPEAVEGIKRWAFDWERGKAGRPILIHGSPGVGKSALAYALAGSMKWPIVEMNASDLRDEESVRRIVGEASTSDTLFGGRRLVLIDEVDGLQRSDRGGNKAIVEVVKNATQPVILTANDIWKPALASIRTASTVIPMRKVNSRTIASILKKIAVKEEMKVADEVVIGIANNSSGDLRSAINDLQALGEGSIGSAVIIGQRDRGKNIFDSVRSVFKATGFAEAREVMRGVDDRDMFVKWIEENIPLEYEKAGEIGRAFEMLSRADVFDGRIMRRQHWGFMRYSNDLATAGVALAKEEPYHKFVKYQFPRIISALGSSRGERAMRKAVGLKIGRRCHLSSKDAVGIFLPLLSAVCKESGNAQKVQDYFDFDDEELEYIIGGKKTSSKAKGKK